MANALNELQLKINQVYQGVAETYVRNYIKSIKSQTLANQAIRVITLCVLMILPVLIGIIEIKRMRYLNSI